MKRRLLILSALVASTYFFACNNSGNNTSSNPYTETPKMSEGKALFVNNCAICHDMKQDKTGPKLEGVFDRWNNDTTKMKAFIRNSSAVIASGDQYTTDLFHKWASTVMTPFPNLTDDELNKIVDYLKNGDI
ncbi:c-type cytochrome [Taibaiella soli]|uniref:Cytochrome c domain-containing protein n=1 Tax=Taibaiella soli TaxID=1649169 RepID=A0A2W2BFJ3_9BACT|nr:cytochrome c [Taibaiella soli]PZF72216.1 hypothetical protein DN068_14895 [Taibaiella soli]